MRIQPTVLAAAVLVVTGCVGAAADAIEAGLVVFDGGEATRCISLPAGSSGLNLLEDAGFQLIYQPPTSNAAVCELAHLGCSFPNAACFCQCESPSSCAYWSLWLLSESDEWALSPVGASETVVDKGTVQGWVWGDGSTPPPATSFGEICDDAGLAAAKRLRQRTLENRLAHPQMPPHLQRPAQ